VVKTLVAIATVLAGCAKEPTTREPDRPFELASARGGFDPHAARPPADYDPLRLAAASAGKLSNQSPQIPSACYVRTRGTANSCATCHTRSSDPNLAHDWELQQNYPFDPSTKQNPWRNQFRDRRALVSRFTDADVLAYIRTDNYAPLRDALARRPDFPGYRPDLDLARGFDAEGFAVDGSGWRAVRYKPFPGFWPSDGSTGDVFVRLPEAFRRDVDGRPSRTIYVENLAILEAAIASDPQREVALPRHYAGGASQVRVVRALYPEGVELLHTVRYLDPDAPGLVSRRLKEVRYARKVEFLEHDRLADVYRAAESPDPPDFEGDALRGLRNAGWLFQGFIEDGHGWLRVQTNEEHRFCMGCHGDLGITVDRTFSLARKVPGGGGWRYQDPHGIPEYAQYLERLGAKPDVAPDDIGRSIFPSRARALELDRAYLANVIEQSYVWGREPNVTPNPDAHATIVERSTGLGEADRVYRDARIWLDWRPLTQTSSLPSHGPAGPRR
jgi:hypothetical protein